LILAEGGEDDEIKQAIYNYNKDTFIVKGKEKIIAIFTLYTTQSWWGQHTWGVLNDGAIYIHRLAINRFLIGSGLGRNMLKWIENYIKDDESVKYFV